MNSLGNNSRLGLLPLLPVSEPGQHVRVLSRNIYTLRASGASDIVTATRQCWYCQGNAVGVVLQC